MAELIVGAKNSNLDEVLQFLDTELEKMGCSMKIQSQIDVAAEEIFVNISQYAYDHDNGLVIVQIEDEGEEIMITFKDNGTPFNPLRHDDPDIKKKAEEREIGGLGIFMVKKMMNNVKYEYKDGSNILSFKKTVK